MCLDARVNKSLTQEQASALLKVRVKIIKDFENGNEIDLPGIAYKVGFVRSYARLLGLDSNLLVDEFKESLELSNVKQEYKFLTPQIERSKLLPIGAAFSFLIATIIYTGWYFSDRNNDFIVATKTNKEIDDKSNPQLANNQYVIIEEDFGSKKTI